MTLFHDVSGPEKEAVMGSQPFVIQRDPSWGKRNTSGQIQEVDSATWLTGFFSRRARATLAVFTAVDSATSGGP
jgi:hypothetical protein